METGNTRAITELAQSEPDLVLPLMPLRHDCRGDYIGDLASGLVPGDLLDPRERPDFARASICESQIAGCNFVHSLAPFVRRETSHSFSNLIEEYKPLLQTTEHALRGPRHLDVLAVMLATALLARSEYEEFPVIVPIPSKQPDRKLRSDLTRIMQRFATLQGLIPELRWWTIEWSILKFVRPVPSLRLTELPRRGAVIENAMAPQRELKRKAPILVIDDIITTSSTLREAVRALRSAGADRLGALTVGKRVR
jgi:predicted amidophosphoribosyltransferase